MEQENFNEIEEQPNSSQTGNQDWVSQLSVMLQKVNLPEKSRVRDQCIYRVPPKIRQVNQEAYIPRVVSIGPFHNPIFCAGHGRLKPMEQLKLKYLKGFLTRTQLSMGDFVAKLKEWKTRIQSSYAEPIKYDSDEFLKMILVDSCFIIEHFLRCYRPLKWKAVDPLLSKQSLRFDVYHDLMLLENQLPFFVLEGIYDLVDVNVDFPSFLEITFIYFRGSNSQNIKPEGMRPQHFTDLLRTFQLPSSVDRGTTERTKVERLYSASQLWEAGLTFKVSPSKCSLDLKYKEGVLTMPCFTIHDETEMFFRNIVAFEECHYPFSPYISEYLAILDFLINTEKDVNILIDKKIIVNWMGDANAVVTMVNSLGSNLGMPDFNPDYYSLCDGLNRFYENPRNKYKAVFIHEYFNTPWKIASTSAAVVLLLLTLIQTICSITSLFLGG